VYTDIRNESSLVESQDNLLEIIKRMRGSPSVEWPGKLCKIKDFGKKRLTEKVSLRKIDSMFPGNGAKMLSHNLYLPKTWMKPMPCSNPMVLQEKGLYIPKCHIT
jgi:hypothetical protein